MKKIFTLCMLAAFLSSQSQVTYNGKPIYQLVIKRAGNYLGTIHLELYPTIAPKHVRNFDSLVSTKFYDTTAFHRVVPGFVIQGGDPNSRHGAPSTWGFGQPGQPTVDAEFGILKHVKGILSMARSTNINSATSQFFICAATTPNLDGQYSIFGNVISGLNLVDTIVNEPANAQDRPLLKIEMFVTYINTDGTVPAPPVLTSPANNSVEADSSFVQLKWNNVPGNLQYHLHVSTDSLFIADTIVATKQLTKDYNLNFKLKGNTKYFWKVSSNNGGHITDSQVWSFHTAGETTGLSSQIKAGSAISVFPNPSSGRFTFSNLEKGSSLQIFDLNGKLISETTVKDNHHQVDLEGKDKGVYTYRIKSGSKNVQGGKLVVK